jgi:hypothetical protein
MSMEPLGTLRVDDTKLLIMRIEDVGGGIREFQCAPTRRTWRSCDDLFSLFSLVLPDGTFGVTLYASLVEARAARAADEQTGQSPKEME